MIPQFPKPCQMKKPKPAVKVFRDGREQCTDTKPGRDEYQRRKRVAWEEQKGICPLCKLKLPWGESSIDHKLPRGMGAGRRDDRQGNIQAVHWWCNSAKGSKRYSEEDGGL